MWNKKVFVRFGLISMLVAVFSWIVEDTAKGIIASALMLALLFLIGGFSGVLFRQSVIKMSRLAPWGKRNPWNNSFSKWFLDVEMNQDGLPQEPE